MHVLVKQADAAALQQELQDLQSSTAKADKQLQSEIIRLQGQLDTAQARQQMRADVTGLQGQLQTALADVTGLQSQLQTALADVTGLQGQLQTALAGCKTTLHKKETGHANSHKDICNLMGQLETAADAHAAQSDVNKLQKQLSGGFISSDLDTKKLQQQLTEAQAAAESALADTQKKALQQQQRTERQARSEQINKLSMAAHHVELLAKVPISISDCADTL